MDKLTSDTLQFVGIVIGLFSVFSMVPVGSVVFYVTGISAIIFSIFTIISSFKLMKSAFGKK